MGHYIYKSIPDAKFEVDSDDERAAATPLIDQFAKIWSECALKTKSHQVSAS